MAQVTANLVKPAPMNMPMSVYNPNASPVASALSSKMGTPSTPKLSYNQRASAGLSPVLTPSQGKISPINTGVSQTPAAQPYASAPAGTSGIADQLESIKQQALKIQSAIPGSSAGTALQAPVQPQGSATGAATASQTPSYSGLVGSLANQQGSQYNQSAQQGIAGLQGTAKVNPGTSGASYDNYLADQDRYKKDLMAYNNTSNGLRTQEGIPLEFQTGRQAAFQLMNSGRLQAEQAAVTNDLAGVGQNISGTQTQQSGYNQAASQALTGQSTQQSALNAAAGYAAPQTGSIGSVAYNPADTSQQNILGSSAQGGLQGAGQLLGQFQGAQSLGAAQANGQAAGIQAQAAAPGQAQAANITTAGTAATNAANTGYQSSLSNYVNANTAYTQATGQAKNLQSAMTGVNALGSQYANQKINQLANQFGSAKYATFITSLNEARQAYTSLLSSVGASTPTVNGQQATDIFNANSTPAQINAAINALDQAAYAKLKPLYDQTQMYQQNLQGGGSTQAPSGNTGGGIYSF